MKLLMNMLQYEKFDTKRCWVLWNIHSNFCYFHQRFHVQEEALTYKTAVKNSSLLYSMCNSVYVHCQTDFVRESFFLNWNGSQYWKKVLRSRWRSNSPRDLPIIMFLPQLWELYFGHLLFYQLTLVYNLEAALSFFSFINIGKQCIYSIISVSYTHLTLPTIYSV